MYIYIYTYMYIYIYTYIQVCEHLYVRAQFIETAIQGYVDQGPIIFADLDRVMSSSFFWWRPWPLPPSLELSTVTKRWPWKGTPRRRACQVKCISTNIPTVHNNYTSMGICLTIHLSTFTYLHITYIYIYMYISYSIHIVYTI